MSELILNRERSRQVDSLAIERYGMTGLVLMENAGRGAAEIVLRYSDARYGASAPIVICCGKGNNGGDGFVVARHLDLAHVAVRILLFCDPVKLTGDAAANYEITRRAGLPIEVFEDDLDDVRLRTSLNGAILLVDALLGTGSKGEPRPPLDRAIDAINEHPAPTFALDIPSGLDCDTGEASAHTIRAARTITFVAPKSGFRFATAKEYVGQVHIVDIGVPRKLLDELKGDDVIGGLGETLFVPNEERRVSLDEAKSIYFLELKHIRDDTKAEEWRARFETEWKKFLRGSKAGDELWEILSPPAKWKLLMGIHEIEIRRNGKPFRTMLISMN